MEDLTNEQILNIIEKTVYYGKIFKFSEFFKWFADEHKSLNLEKINFEELSISTEIVDNDRHFIFNLYNDQLIKFNKLIVKLIDFGAEISIGEFGEKNSDKLDQRFRDDKSHIDDKQRFRDDKQRFKENKEYFICIYLKINKDNLQYQNPESFYQLLDVYPNENIKIEDIDLIKPDNKFYIYSDNKYYEFIKKYKHKKVYLEINCGRFTLVFYLKLEEVEDVVKQYQSGDKMAKELFYQSFLATIDLKKEKYKLWNEETVKSLEQNLFWFRLWDTDFKDVKTGKNEDYDSFERYDIASKYFDKNNFFIDDEIVDDEYNMIYDKNFKVNRFRMFISKIKIFGRLLKYMIMKK